MSALHADLPDLQTALDRLSTQTVPVRTTSPDLLGQLRQARDVTVRRIVCIGTDSDVQCDLQAQALRANRPAIDRALLMLKQWFDAKLLLIEAPSSEYHYPNLLPEILVRRLTHKALPFGELPTRNGVLVIDALTAAGVLAPLTTGEKQIDSAGIAAAQRLPVIIDDYLLRRRFRAAVDAATPVTEVLAQASVDVRTVDLQQGPLAANSAVDPNAAVGQTELWFHALPPATTPAAACTRCGECVSICPVRLQPAALLEAAQLGNAKMARRFHASSCIECGLCTAVCPSSLPVKIGVLAAKRLVA